MADPEFDAQRCLEGIRRQDEAAAREFLQGLYPMVLRLVRAHLPRRTAEEDLCQMIFMKVFANIDQYSGEKPIEHWVSRIAINTCLNQIKAEKIRPELRWADLSEEQQHVVDSLAATSDELGADQQLASRDLVERLLESLNPEDRLIINLLHIEERSVEEIHQITGWSRALIKVRAFRARNKLKKHLAVLTREEKSCAGSIINCIAC